VSNTTWMTTRMGGIISDMIKTPITQRIAHRLHMDGVTSAELEAFFEQNPTYKQPAQVPIMTFLKSLEDSESYGRAELLQKQKLALELDAPAMLQDMLANSKVPELEPFTAEEAPEVEPADDNTSFDW